LSTIRIFFINLIPFINQTVLFFPNHRNIQHILRPFFQKHDSDCNGELELSHLSALLRYAAHPLCVLSTLLLCGPSVLISSATLYLLILLVLTLCLPLLFIVISDLGEQPSKEAQELFERLDKDNDGAIDFDEFVRGASEYLERSEELYRSRTTSAGKSYFRLCYRDARVWCSLILYIYVYI